jgi:hypothetical protein
LTRGPGCRCTSRCRLPGPVRSNRGAAPPGASRGPLAEDRRIESDNSLISDICKISDYPELWRGSHNISLTICYQSICVQLPPLYTDPVRRLQLVASPPVYASCRVPDAPDHSVNSEEPRPTTGSSVFFQAWATGSPTARRQLDAPAAGSARMSRAMTQLTNSKRGRDLPRSDACRRRLACIRGPLTVTREWHQRHARRGGLQGRKQ